MDYKTNNYERTNRKKKNSNFLYFSLGILVFSRFSSHLINDIIGFPFYLIEIPLLIFCVIKYKSVILWLKKVVNKKLLILIFIALTYILVVLFSIKRNSSFFEVLSVSRGGLYIAIFAMLSSVRQKEYSYEFLFYLSLGALFGDFISQVFITDSEALKLNNLLTTTFAIMLPIIHKKKIHVVIALSLALFVSFFSGYRISLLLFFISLMIVITSFGIKKVKSMKVKAFDFVLFFLFTLVIASYKRIADLFFYFMQNIVHMDPYSFYRVTKRFYQALTLNFDASRDTMRFEAYSSLYTDFLEKLIPTGLAGRTIGIGIYYDLPMMYLYDAIGSLASFLLIVFILFISVPRFVYVFTSIRPGTDAVIALSLPVLLILFILNARFFLITYESIFMGLVLGRLISKNFTYRIKLK